MGLVQSCARVCAFVVSRACMASLGPVCLETEYKKCDLVTPRSVLPLASEAMRCLTSAASFFIKAKQSGVNYLDQHQLCPFKQLHGCVTSASSQSPSRQRVLHCRSGPSAISLCDQGTTTLSHTYHILLLLLLSGGEERR